MLIGTGGTTALAQGIAATILYAAVGIPRALLLGPLTMIAALIPVFGTGLVWAPLAAGLAITGEWGRAAAIALLGVGVLSTMGNFLRPILSRRGRLRMPTFLVLVSMLGGVSAFGASGILLGPLLVALALEALRIGRSTRLFRREREEITKA